MSYSKRQLYAAGEPLGDSVTRAKLGGGYVCGGGGGSRSSQASSNYDQRVAVQDGIGLSASNGNTINVQAMDAEVVGKALDSVNLATVQSGENYTALLEVSEGMFSKSMDVSEGMFGKSLDAMTKVFNEGQGLIGQTQKAVADAYGQAQNDKAGTIDNRTIIVLAVAGAAALVAMNHKG
jgi:flagellar biosynthesis/type III secretory pathway ATPase